MVGIDVEHVRYNDGNYQGCNLNVNGKTVYVHLDSQGCFSLYGELGQIIRDQNNDIYTVLWNGGKDDIDNIQTVRDEQTGRNEQTGRDEQTGSSSDYKRLLDDLYSENDPWKDIGYYGK